MKLHVSLICVIALSALCFVCVQPARAQFGGGPGGPGAGARPAPNPAWEAWRTSHKNIFEVNKTVRALEQLEQEPGNQLTRQQAGSIVSVLKRWRNKPVMSDKQAKVVVNQLTSPLNIAQLQKVTQFETQRRGGGMGMGGGMRPGGGAPGGPGGPGGAGGPRPAFKMPAPRDFNPLNPSTSPMARPGSPQGQQLDGFIQLLSTIAGK